MTRFQSSVIESTNFSGPVSNTLIMNQYVNIWPGGDGYINITTTIDAGSNGFVLIGCNGGPVGDDTLLNVIWPLTGVNLPNFTLPANTTVGGSVNYSNTFYFSAPPGALNWDIQWDASNGAIIMGSSVGISISTLD
jgi:hypothetical protein